MPLPYRPRANYEISRPRLLMSNEIVAAGLLLCCFLYAVVPCPAQYASRQPTAGKLLQLPFDRFTVDNGLSQGMVRSIIQDSRGYMWFATKDGLNRYDGYGLTVYRNNPDDPHSIPDNQVSALLEDPNGNFWIGTSTKGLCVFDPRTEKFYKVPLGTKSRDGFYEDIGRMEYKNGDLIVRLGPSIVIVDVRNITDSSYDKQNLPVKIVFTTDNIKPANTDDPLNFLLLANSNILIAGSDSCYLLTQPAPNTFKVSSRRSIKSTMFNGILPDGAVADSATHRYYITSRFGNNNYQQNFNNIPTFGNYRAVPAFKDSSGKIWVLDTTLYQFDPVLRRLEKIVSADAAITPLLKNIISFCVDRNGIIWMGTGVYGMLKFDSRLTRFNKFNLGSIYYLSVDKNGLLNFFPPGHKVNPAAFDPKDYGVPHSLIPENLVRPEWTVGDVTDIVNDSAGSYWMVINTNNQAPPGKSPAYLLQYNPAQKKLTQHLTGQQLAGYRFKAIMPAKDGTLWIFGNDPLKAHMVLAYNPVRDKIDGVYRLPVASGLDNYPFISAWWQAADGDFWFGTRRFGLLRFNPRRQEWKQYGNNVKDTFGLPSDRILSLCPDFLQPDKYLWLGTEGSGFCRFEYSTGKCVRYSEKNGLANNVVYGMLADTLGHLWLSTNHGLSCFLNAEQYPVPNEAVFINFTKRDGIQDDEFNRYSYAKMPDGSLVFGGVNGITWFKPAEILKKDIAAPLVFTGLSVFNKPVTWLTDSNIIQQPAEYAQSITLPFSKNMFSVSFSLLEYSPPEKKKYRYYLEGFDKQWINNGSKNEAAYTNLDPATYILHVQAAGRTGEWNGDEKTLVIIIMPPWWYTLWFRCLVLAAALALIYTVYRYRLHQALKVQYMRNNIASDLHDEIGSTLSSISISSMVIQNRLQGTTPDVKDLLKQISHNTDDMMEAMSDIVWSVNTKNDQFDNITARMREFATSILEPQNCLLHLTIGPGTERLKLNIQQRKNLYLVFKEAINNAAKYAGCANVWVVITLTGKNRLRMDIKDDGTGFEIVGRKSNATFTKPGNGNGLANMHKRAAELRGSLHINTCPGEGTEICLDFAV